MEQKKICFLIDDDEDDQEIFRLALREVDEKITCLTAFNGVEALDRLSNASFIPHYIFLDMNMPRMSGSQCLAAIKRIERLTKIPVYMYSTSSNKEVIEELMLLGASGYIVKPSSISDLTKVLGSYLGIQSMT